MKLEDHVRRYIELALRADMLFDLVNEAHGDLMPCGPGCDDCCSVYFELTLIEAFVINGMFRQVLPPEVQENVLDKAESVEPEFQQTRVLFRDAIEIGDACQERLVQSASRARILCPLNGSGTCILYEHRPITCRVYGTPQLIGDRVVSCPRTGFRKGESYQSVNVAEIQHLLFDYSSELLSDLVGVALTSPPGPLFSLPTTLKTQFD